MVGAGGVAPEDLPRLLCSNALHDELEVEAGAEVEAGDVGEVDPEGDLVDANVVTVFQAQPLTIEVGVPGGEGFTGELGEVLFAEPAVLEVGGV